MTNPNNFDNVSQFFANKIVEWPYLLIIPNNYNSNIYIYISESLMEQLEFVKYLTVIKLLIS